MAGASRILQFMKSNFLGVDDVDLLGLLLRFFTCSFDLRVVDRSVVCHLSPRPAPPAPQSLSHNISRHRSPSRRPARGCVSCFCVLRDEYNLSVDRTICPFFAWLASSCCCSWVRLLYSYPPHHSLTSTGWRGPGRPTRWRVGVRLAHLVRHHRLHRPHSG